MRGKALIVELGRRLRSAARWLHNAQESMPPPEVTVLLLVLCVGGIAAAVAFAWTYPVVTAVGVAIGLAVRFVWKAGAP